MRPLIDKPSGLLVNRRHHVDHTGGNTNRTKASAVILVHENVVVPLKQPNRGGSNNPKETLSVITSNDKMTTKINGEQVISFHADSSYTNRNPL